MASAAHHLWPSADRSQHGAAFEWWEPTPAFSTRLMCFGGPNFTATILTFAGRHVFSASGRRLSPTQANMPTCFVIQPFDGGKFDKRFDDVFSPAIKAAGLEPYRVDKDPAVDVPIDAIEEGIRSAVLCLADITTDNPNVWYELGFAFASGRPVVMVCSDERTGKKYPFDIQHRTITPYRCESTQDFEKLQSDITARIKALLKRTENLRSIRDSEQVAPVEGLTQPELAVLATVAGSVILPDEGVTPWSVRHDVERAGFTALGFTIGLKRLREKGLLVFRDATDDHGEKFQAVVVTADGWSWIEHHENKFIIKRPNTDAAAGGADDVPF